ncbi:MAG: hypothetical protein AAGJ18_27520 [Bacteroidota bacterium]
MTQEKLDLANSLSKDIKRLTYQLDLLKKYSIRKIHFEFDSIATWLDFDKEDDKEFFESILDVSLTRKKKLLQQKRQELLDL